MNKSRGIQLVKNTIIVAIGQICTKFITFFLLPLYTSILSAKEYGIVDLLNTYISLLIPIAFLQMNQAIFRFLIDARSDENEKKKLISTCLIFVFFQSIIYLLIFIIISSFIKNEYKFFLLSNVIVCMLSDLVLQISRGLGDNKTYSQGSLISGAGAVILNVLFIAVFRYGAYGMLSATLLSNFFCFIYVFLKKKLFKYIKYDCFDLRKLKELLKYSLPLIPNQISWWIVNASDRIIISSILGIAYNGIYSAANKFSGICISIFSVFNMTWSESASLHINDEDSSKFFSDIVNKTVKLFSCLCILIICIMPFIFKYLITGSEYSSAYYQIPILMLATLFNILVSLFGSIYVALKKSKEIAKTSVYSAIINIFINVFLIRYIGLYAASISTFIAYFLMSIYRYIDIQKYVKINIENNFIISSIPLFIMIIIFYYIKIKSLCFVIFMITIAYSIFFNKKIIKDIIIFIKNKRMKGR